MRGIGFDPYCLQPQGQPEPVEGPLPPVYAVEDDPLPGRPPWIRVVAALLLAVFGAAIAVAAAHGRSVLLPEHRAPPQPAVSP